MKWKAKQFDDYIDAWEYGVGGYIYRHDDENNPDRITGMCVTYPWDDAPEGYVKALNGYISFDIHEWDGNIEVPTLSPSIGFAQKTDGTYVFHGWLKDGYLMDDEGYAQWKEENGG